MVESFKGIDQYGLINNLDECHLEDDDCICDIFLVGMNHQRSTGTDDRVMMMRMMMETSQCRSRQDACHDVCRCDHDDYDDCLLVWNMMTHETSL